MLVPVLGVKRLDESAATEVLHAFASVAPKPDSGSDDDETVADMKQAAAQINTNTPGGVGYFF